MDTIIWPGIAIIPENEFLQGRLRIALSLHQVLYFLAGKTKICGKLIILKSRKLMKHIQRRLGFLAMGRMPVI